MEREIDAQRELLSSALHTAISGVADKRSRNKLLELRRSLFHGKRPGDSAMEIASTTLTETLQATVHSVVKLFDVHQRLIADIHQQYSHATIQARNQLRELLGNEDFQAGLALSSETLFRNLSAYRRMEGGLKGSRLEQIERGLLRYFTRMATKATPFSRFCAVIGGEFDTTSHRQPLVGFAGDPFRKQSIIRLNKRICAQLWDKLNRQPAVRDRLMLEANPTLTIEGGRFVFMTSLGGREVFQRMPIGEVTEVVLALVRTVPARSFGEVCARLAADPRLETTDDEARAFLNKLIDLGLLRTPAVVAEQVADWLDPLLAFLTPIKDEYVDIAVNLLQDLRELVKRYESSVALERATVLGDIRARLQLGFDALKLFPWMPHDLPLYEDATADARFLVRDAPALQEALDALSQWVTLTLPMARDRGEMAGMRHFYDNHYDVAANDTGVPLLKFYEDFYRGHFKTHLEKMNLSRQGKPDPAYDVNNPFGIKFVTEFRRAGDLLFRTLRGAWAEHPDAEEVTITLPMVKAALQGISKYRIGEQSTNIFCQLVSMADGSARVVMPSGNYAPGYGKFFSRFLYLLPEQWQSEVFDANSKLGPSLLAEICGDGAFNANLHPPLLPYEINYPTPQGGGSADQLLCSELNVLRDPDDPHMLQLVRNGSGERVWPVDLGFLNLNMRPPLYQLLTRFSPVRFFGVPLPFTAHSPKDGPVPEKAGVIHRPRITLEGSVVLSRRTWIVSQDGMPIPAGGESDAEYFLRVARWRSTHNIPSRVYIRVRPMSPGIVQTAQGPSPDGEQAGVHQLEQEAHAENADMGMSVPEGDEQENVAEHADPNVDQPADHPVDQKVERTDGKIDGAGTAVAAAGKPRDRASRDYKKPQFIDFNNPLLVQLFARLPSGLKQYLIVLEECLPDVEQLPVANGERFAVEMILQLSYPES